MEPYWTMKYSQSWNLTMYCGTISFRKLINSVHVPIRKTSAFCKCDPSNPGVQSRKCKVGTLSVNAPWLMFHNPILQIIEQQNSYIQQLQHYLATNVKNSSKFFLGDERLFILLKAWCVNDWNCKNVSACSGYDRPSWTPELSQVFTEQTKLSE